MSSSELSPALDAPLSIQLKLLREDSTDTVRLFHRYRLHRLTQRSHSIVIGASPDYFVVIAGFQLAITLSLDDLAFQVAGQFGGRRLLS